MRTRLLDLRVQPDVRVAALQRPRGDRLHLLICPRGRPRRPQVPEVIGLDCGESETEAFWHEFLRGLVKLGLSGVVQLVVSDAHEGLKQAIG